MGKLTKYRVLFLGILSPIMAVLLSALVNGALMRWSADTEKDWLFRLSVSTSVMVAPFAVTLVLAMKDRRFRLAAFREDRAHHSHSFPGSHRQACK